MNINSYELNGYWYASASLEGISGTASKKQTLNDAISKAVGIWLNKYWAEKENRILKHKS